MKKNLSPKSDLRVILLLSMIAVAYMCIRFTVDIIKSDEGENLEIRQSETEMIINSKDGGLQSAGQKLSTFDPNTADSMTLATYGLGPAQIHSLLSYRRHGGRFDTPLAVSKLYNWADHDVEKVLPYIRIGEKFKRTFRYRRQYEAALSAERKYSRKSYAQREDDKEERFEDHHDNHGSKAESYEPKYGVENKFTTLTQVDINTADTALLKRIPGVGTATANAIIRLRKKLGGFYQVEQLADISFLSPELYQWFKVENPTDLHLIYINKANFTTLNSHPYISYNQARDIVNYRRLYGTIKDMNALIGTHIFTVEEVERLKHYLEF